jgi:hypothetical protein
MSKKQNNDKNGVFQKKGGNNNTLENEIENLSDSEQQGDVQEWMRRMVAPHVNSFDAFLSVYKDRTVKYIDPISIVDTNTGETLTGIYNISLSSPNTFFVFASFFSLSLFFTFDSSRQIYSHRSPLPSKIKH